MTSAVDVLAMHYTHESVVEALEGKFRLHKLWETKNPNKLLAEVTPSVRGLIVDGGPVDDELLSRFPKLEIVSQYGVGYDRIDAAAAARRGIVVTNTPNVLDDDVADLAIALLLAVTRELRQADSHVRSGKWPAGDFRLTASLRGRTVGILGLGRIGKTVGRRLEGFGVPICYSGRTRQADVPYEYVPGAVELARKVDGLICVLPGGSATRHVVNAEVLEALGRDGILVNVGRGSTVDQQALIAALESGAIRAAGLDVFEGEPQVPERLLKLDNVVLTPHIGAGSVATRVAMGKILVANLVEWFAGRGARTPVPETAHLRPDGLATTSDMEKRKTK